MEPENQFVRDYRDLVVWQEAMTLAEKVYHFTTGFPGVERYGLTSQMRRCSVSIPSNIAEGFGRAQRQSFIQFLRIAQGSLKELETQIELSRRLSLLEQDVAAATLESCNLLGKRLVMFIRSLEKRR